MVQVKRFRKKFRKSRCSTDRAAAYWYSCLIPLLLIILTFLALALVTLSTESLSSQTTWRSLGTFYDSESQVGGDGDGDDGDGVHVNVNNDEDEGGTTHKIPSQIITPSSSSSSLQADFTLDCTVNFTHDAFQNASFQSTWKEIGEFLSSSEEHRKEKKSGGIFLYPRQSHLLQHIVHSLSIFKRQSDGQSNNNDNDDNNIQICETGFAAGHSSALFLSTVEHANIVSFDKFDRTYQIPIAQTLQEKYDHRLTHVKGNSCHTVPKYMERERHGEREREGDESQFKFKTCDILHGSSLCPTDNIDLVRYAPCGTILTSTAMPSVKDRSVYFGKTPKAQAQAQAQAQWRKLRADGCIDHISCFTEEPHVLDRAFVFTKNGKNEMIQHEFCVAIVTGKCYHDHHEGMSTRSGSTVTAKRNDGNVGCDVTQQANMFQDICPTWKIEVPS